MAAIITSNLSAMQLGRLNAQLDKQYHFSSIGVAPMRQWIEAQTSITKSETDGMMDYSRTRFNRMDNREQAEYMARLKSRRHYFINNVKVPKIVFDAVKEA